MVRLGEPNPSLPGTGRKRPERSTTFTAMHKSEYRTVCKLCPEGIYTGDDAVWIRGRLIGLAHRPCAVKVGVVIVEQQPAAPAPKAGKR